MPVVAERQAKVALTLVSPKVGLIRRLRKLPGIFSEPTTPVFYEAVLADFDFTGEGKPPRAGAGKGETHDQAVLGAIGEAVERYCAWQIDYDSIFFEPYARLKSRTISPHELVLYSSEQYATREVPYSVFNEDLTIGWKDALSLPTREPILVPASMTYLGDSTSRPEDHLCQLTSNGLAAGFSVEAAVLSALCELIERDAFMIAWINRLPVPRLLFDQLEGFPNRVRLHYERRGIELYAFDITLDIPVYTIAGIAIDRSGGYPSAVVGLGCSLNPTIALTRAIFEVCQVRYGAVWRYRNQQHSGDIKEVTEVHKPRDHASLFAKRELLKELSFLLDTPHSHSIHELANRATGDVSSDLTKCVNTLVEAGCRVAFADVTTPDVASVGYNVVRAFATGLQPIHFGYRQERLGGRRIFEVPRTLGFESKIRSIDELNRFPHPLA